MNKILVVILVVYSSASAFGQDGHLSSRGGESSFGLGLGMPYGAIGARFMTNVADNFGLFGGVGYHLAGPGYNFGMLYSFPSNGEIEFYLTGMYGTNGATVVEGLTDYDEVFMGGTFGVGVKLNSRRKEGNFWDFGLLVPIHGTDFDDQISAIKNDSRVGGVTEPIPVAIVVGYNFNL